MGTGTLSSASLFLWLLVRFLFFILLPGRSTYAVTVSLICLRLSKPPISGFHRLGGEGWAKCQQRMSVRGVGPPRRVNEKGGVGCRPQWRGCRSRGAACRLTWVWITELMWGDSRVLLEWRGGLYIDVQGPKADCWFGSNWQRPSAQAQA